ncbi:MAG: DUF5615 family PIN-like protein [Acidobacteriota bacterium]|nr:MAG: DUF5615 family PIN-like protein [Acidobacteriota bacterium]
MKFLVDAHLPKRLAGLLKQVGHDAVHTRDLPLGNRTKDSEIIRISLDEGWVVVTKDADFVETIILKNQPWKLLLVSTGNITNLELESLFKANLEKIAEGFVEFDFIELDRNNLIYHF